MVTWDPVAKFLLLCGGGLILIGLAWQFGWIQSLKLGRLPGDIYIDRDNVKIYIPLTTGLLVSGLISFLTWLFKR